MHLVNIQNILGNITTTMTPKIRQAIHPQVNRVIIRTKLDEITPRFKVMLLKDGSTRCREVMTTTATITTGLGQTVRRIRDPQGRVRTMGGMAVLDRLPWSMIIIHPFTRLELEHLNLSRTRVKIYFFGPFKYSA